MITTKLLYTKACRCKLYYNESSKNQHEVLFQVNFEKYHVAF